MQPIHTRGVVIYALQNKKTFAPLIFMLASLKIVNSHEKVYLYYVEDTEWKKAATRALVYSDTRIAMNFWMDLRLLENVRLWMN
jgi:hypothetical protein